MPMHDFLYPAGCARQVLQPAALPVHVAALLHKARIGYSIQMADSQSVQAMELAMAGNGEQWSWPWLGMGEQWSWSWLGIGEQ